MSRAARFNVLPPGSVLCGWCEAFEAKAQKAEADAAAMYEPALDALRAIARIEKCAQYCEGPPDGRCSRCQAKRVLREHGWTRTNRAKR